MTSERFTLWPRVRLDKQGASFMLNQSALLYHTNEYTLYVNRVPILINCQGHCIMLRHYWQAASSHNMSINQSINQIPVIIRSRSRVRKLNRLHFMLLNVLVETLTTVLHRPIINQSINPSINHTNHPPWIFACKSTDSADVTSSASRFTYACRSDGVCWLCVQPCAATINNQLSINQ